MTASISDQPVFDSFETSIGGVTLAEMLPRNGPEVTVDGQPGRLGAAA